MVRAEDGHFSKNGECICQFNVASFDLTTKFIYIYYQPNQNPRPSNIASQKPSLFSSPFSNTLLLSLNKFLSNFKSPRPANDISPTENLPANGRRSSSPEILDSRKNGIGNHIRRGTFKIVLVEYLPNIFKYVTGSLRSITEIISWREIIHKTFFVIGVPRDKLKDLVFHTSKTLKFQSILPLLPFAKIYGFNFWNSDVIQSYLQSSVPLSQELYLASPVPELELSGDQFMQILKPLYGLS